MARADAMAAIHGAKARIVQHRTQEASDIILLSHVQGWAM